MRPDVIAGSRRVRRQVAAVLLFACGVLLSGGASAQTLVSASYRLRAGTFAGAGSIGLTSSAGTPAIGTLHALASQAGTLGRSVGPVSDRVLEGGFYPATRFVPEPSVPVALAVGFSALMVMAPGRRRAPRPHRRRQSRA